MQATPQDSTAGHYQGNVDAAEVAKFEALASRWWDPQGEFKPLHEINLCGSILLMRVRAWQEKKCWMWAVAAAF